MIIITDFRVCHNSLDSIFLSPGVWNVILWSNKTSYFSLIVKWKWVKPDFSWTNHGFSINFPTGSMHEWPFYGTGMISQLIQCGQSARIANVTHTLCFTCQNQRSPEVLTRANEFTKNGALLHECQSVWLLHWSAHTQDTVCLCSQTALLLTHCSRNTVQYMPHNIQYIALRWSRVS